MKMIGKLGSTILLCSLVCLGCSSKVQPSSDVNNPVTTTLAKFKDLVKDGKPFAYIGCDKEFYYFGTVDGYLKIPLSEEIADLKTEIKRDQMLEKKIGTTFLFCKFEGDRLSRQIDKDQLSILQKSLSSVAIKQKKSEQMK